MLKVPERPAVAPQGADDREKATERIRFAQAYLKLEGQFVDLVCYVTERKPPCPKSAAGP
jgi:hypothetical protein